MPDKGLSQYYAEAEKDFDEMKYREDLTDVQALRFAVIRLSGLLAQTRDRLNVDTKED